MAIRADHSPEFTFNQLRQWAYFNGVELALGHPNEPADNAFIGSSNVRLRQECLNWDQFPSMDETQGKMEP